MLPLLIFIVLPHFSTSGLIGKIFPYTGKTNCGLNEVFRTCGPKCPPTCDTLKDTICCEVACVVGCFCADGYMLETKNGPRKCLPIAECPSPGILQFRQKRVDFLEGVEVARIPVIRVNGSYGKVTVRWRSGGPFPYQGKSGILTFPDGVVSQYIEIPIDDNKSRNPDVTFYVELFDPSDKAEIAVGYDKIIVTIIDDDMKPGYPEMERTNIIVSENVGTVKINVLRMEGADGQISVRYKTIPGTANDFTDFTPTSGELVFEEGEALKSIFVNIVDDNVREKPETFHVQLFDPKAGPGVRNFKPLGVRMTTTVTIKDDDMNPGYLELESPSLIVPETVGTVRIKVLRKQGTDGQIKIRYKTVEDTAIANLDFKPVEGELVFEEGEKIKIVEVEIINDDVREKAEKFRFQLYDPSTGPDVVNFKHQGSILSTEITIIDDDMKPGYLELEKSTYVVSEGVGTVRVCVVREGGSDGEIRVWYKTVAKTAQAGQDFKPANGKLVFYEGETQKCVIIQIINDNIREPTEVFEVVIYDPSAAPDVINFSGLGPRRKATITIEDDDMQPGRLEFEKSLYVVSENVGTVKVGVVRVGGSDGTIRVLYKTVPKTAQAGQDFQPTNGMLTFKEGETLKFISIRITNDNIREPTEFFEVVLYDSTADPDVINFLGIGSRTTTTIKIIDDDMKPGLLELEKSNYVVAEDIGTVKVSVVRVGGSDGEISVWYKTVPKTALAGQDFQPKTGQLVFKDGESLKYISIEIINDYVREHTETFEVVIYNATAAPDVINFHGLGARRTATISITDNDMKPGYLQLEKSTYVVSEGVGTVRVCVVREGGSDGEIRVWYKTVAKTAQAGQDFKPANGKLVFYEGETQKCVIIQIINDNIREPTEFFEVVIYDPSAAPDVINFSGLGPRTKVTITIEDDDMQPGRLEFEKSLYVVSENVGTVKVGVVRVGGSDGTIRVLYKTVPKTAQAGQDFQPTNGMLTFKEGETLKFISIRITNDNIREPTEFFEVVLYDSTADPDVINFLGIGSRTTTTIKIIDDDMKPGLLELEKSNYVVAEDIGTVKVGVVRVGGSDGEIRVWYKTVPKTALAGQDFQPKTGQLVFKDGESLKYISIEIINDYIREHTETFEVVIYNATAAPDVINFHGLGARRTATISITDNDMKPGYLQLEKSTYVVLEGVGTVRVCVVREEGSDGEIRVWYKTVVKTAQAGQDFKPANGKLVFYEGETQKCVIIQIINDNIREPTEFFEVVIYDPSAAPDVINFSGLGPRTKATITIENDDMQPGRLEFEKSLYVVSENVGTVKVGVVRVGGSDGTIRVLYKTVPKTAQAGQDFQPTNGMLTFKEGETLKFISIRITNDNIREPTEFFEVVLYDSTADPDVINFLGIGSRTTTTIKIIDDDMKPGYLELENSNYVVAEDTGTVKVGVVRVGGNDGEICVRYKTVPKTALAGQDFQPKTGQLVFKDGESLKYISIEVINDYVREPTKIFEVVIYNATAGSDVINFHGLGARRIATISITDNDMKPGYLQLEKSTYVVSEGVGTVRVCVVREGGSDEEIRVWYKTVAKTAQTGQDFKPANGKLVFYEGETQKCVIIQIINDNIREPTEFFEVVIYDPSAAPDVINFSGLGPRTKATITIEDDDMQPGRLEFEKAVYVISENVGIVKVGVVRVDGSDGEIRVLSKTVPKTAQAGQDFESTSGELIFKEGETLQFISVRITDDNVREPTEIFEVVLYDFTATPDVINFRGIGTRTTTVIRITDDDSKPGFLEVEKSTDVISEDIGKVKFCVVRLEGSDGDIRVFYKTVDKSALANQDFIPAVGELTFKERETQMCIFIQIINDNIREPTKIFDVVLYDFNADANFRGLGSRRTTTISITDDDMKPGYLELGKRTYIVSENVGTVSIEVVRLDGSDGEIRVRYKTIARTALDKLDFQPADGELVFKEGETRKFILIRIINDNIKESTEIFEVQLYDSKPGPGVINFRGLGSTLTITVTINDDDNRPGVLEMEKTNVAVPEDVGVAQVTIVRTGGEDGKLVVKYTTVDGTAQAGSDYIFSSGEIDFQDGQIRQTLTIPIVDDNEKEPMENFQVQIVTDENPASKTLTIVTIIDNDETPGTFQFRETSISVQEGDLKVRLTVLRRGGTDGSVALNWRTIDGTATEGFDYKARQGSITFNEGETEKSFLIEIIDDQTKEDNEKFIVGLFDPTHGVLGQNNMITVTILDNDNRTPGTFEFRETSISVQEGDLKVRLTVLRRGGTDGSVTLNWRTIDGTATEGFDYKARQGSITFNEGETEKSFLIEIIDDQTKEDNEKFIVGLFDPTHGVLGQNNMITVTILDNDNSNPVPSTSVVSTNIQTFFTTPNVRVNRGSSIARFHVRRSGDLRPISFFLETRDGTAKAGVDYRRTKGEIEFSKNEIELTIEIKLIENRNAEGIKFFLVKLSNPSVGIVVPGKDVLAILIGDDASNFGDIKYTDLGFEIPGTKTGTSGSFTEISKGKGSFSESISSSKTSGTSVDFTGTSGISGSFIKRPGISGDFTGTSGSIGSSIKTSGISGGFTGSSGSTGGFIRKSGTSGGYIGTSGSFSGSITGASGVDGNFEGRVGINRNVGVSDLNKGHKQVVETVQVQQREFEEFGKAKIKCPAGMTYRICAPTCPKSCATLNKGPSCDKKCINACFCPDGLVIENLQSLRCIPPSQCRAQAVLTPQGDSGIGGLLGGLGGLGGLGLGGLLSG